MSDPRLTTEAELQPFIAQRGTLTEAQVREQYRWACAITERDPFDFVPDAFDTFMGYGPTAQDAHARAFAQTYASARQVQAWEELE